MKPHELDDILGSMNFTIFYTQQDMLNCAVEGKIPYSVSKRIERRLRYMADKLERSRNNDT